MSFLVKTRLVNESQQKISVSFNKGNKQCSSKCSAKGSSGCLFSLTAAWSCLHVAVPPWWSGQAWGASLMLFAKPFATLTLVMLPWSSPFGWWPGQCHFLRDQNVSGVLLAHLMWQKAAWPSTFSSFTAYAGMHLLVKEKFEAFDHHVWLIFLIQLVNISKGRIILRNDVFFKG